MTSKYKLFEAEYRFMEIVWEREPINSTQLKNICVEKLGWKKSTTYTVIKKLRDRDVIHSENAMIVALVKKEQVQKYESQQLIEETFGNSLPSFLNTFLQGKKLTKQESNELKEIIDTYIIEDLDR